MTAAWIAVAFATLLWFISVGMRKRASSQRKIIELLTVHKELTGRQLVELSDGELEPGVVYVDLDALEDAGVVRRRICETVNGLPIHYFSLTGNKRGRRKVERDEFEGSLVLT